MGRGVIASTAIGLPAQPFQRLGVRRGKVTLREIDGQRALADPIVRERVLTRRLPNHTVSDLLIPMSIAVDLAEGRAPGHAQRVAFIATSLAGALGLDSGLRLASCYAGLMHDIGVIASGSRLGAYVRGDERLVYASLPLLSPEEVAVTASDEPDIVIERLVEHTIHGSLFAQELDLPQEAIRGIAAHHESWDGSGYPHGLAGEGIPIVGRIVSVADYIESMISQTSPLQARRNLPHRLAPLAGSLADPLTIHALRLLGSDDMFWLGLFSSNLAGELSAICTRLREPKAARIQAFAESLSHLVDSRFSFTAGVSMKVAHFSEALGQAAGVPEARLPLLRLAALLHDVGQLSVSERIMAKPGILSVDELDELRLHPQYSSEIVRGVPGLEEVALWVAAHHERPDGRGYPYGLTGDEIPLESRILAVADTYVAMISDRPHRPRMDAEDAMRRLRGAAGTQLDARLVHLFIEHVVV
jgi:HD-GYP domain-containing protein (c-di-GMP phosphodiesterase class II)